MTHVHAYIYHSQIKSPNNLHILQCKPPNKRDLITAISASFSLQTHYLFAFLLCRLDACYQNRCIYKYLKISNIHFSDIHVLLSHFSQFQTDLDFIYPHSISQTILYLKKKPKKNTTMAVIFLQFEIKVGILQWICSCKLCNVHQGPLALFLLVRLVHE